MSRRKQKLAAEIALAALCSIFLLGCDQILHGEHTEFAGGYSEHKFQQIKQGMPMQDIVSLLGPPLSQRTQQWSEVWSYRPPGTQSTTTRTKDGATIFSNVFGKITHLRFTPIGTVMTMSGDYLSEDLAGLTKEQVRAKVGAPHSRTLREFQIIYRYTAPGKRGSGTYKRREVHFDGSNKVSSVVAKMYYD
jgi:outer membrane protein assembly factor BamE (lipoprotein component of BamABCDE complex)